MPRHPILLAVLLLAAAPAAAAPIGLAERGTPAGCPITVAFGSLAAGIDQAAYASLGAHLKGAPQVASARAIPWGKEGEVTLCVTPRPGQGAALFRALARLVPMRATAPVELAYRDLAGRVHRKASRP